MEFARLIRTGAPIERMSETLDAQTHEQRLAEIAQLSRRDLAQLFDLAAGRGCTLDLDFVPADRAPLDPVIHHGRNSLPAFRSFQKRFARPSRSHVPSVVLGYNEQTMMPFTGPGYFVAREDVLEGTSTVVIDYRQIPDEKPATWPAILPNSARLGRFVYDDMQDWMWKVSRHVTIGRARKSQGWMDAWFVLCREG